MDATAFLEFAERILNPNSDEATRRSASSRAYYAAYLHAERLVDVSRVETVSAGPHERVIRALMASGLPDADLQATILRELKTERTTADYVMTVSYSFFRARSVVVKARGFCNWAASIAGDR